MKLRIIIATSVLLSAGLGITWAAVALREDSDVKEVQEIQKKLFEADEEEVSQEERRELVTELREKTEALPEEKRKEVFEGMQQVFMKRMEERMDEFFDLPEEERTAALDKHIDDMEERRTRWEEIRKQREEERAKREEEAQAAADSSDGADSDEAESGATEGSAPASGENAGQAGGNGGQNAQANDGQGNRRGRGSFRNATPEQREEFRRRMLDMTTPKQRAQFTEFMRLLQERRKERGLPERRGGFF